MTTNEDIRFMQRCFHLAQLGLGRVRPNPMVGCVVVKDGTILSEGYHQQYGHWHAERNALLHAQAQGLSTQGATLYVNLEPCSHYGKTPPCANLIVECGIKRVVCSCDDPNPLVAGRGFEILQTAGIEVEQHLLEAEGRALNRRFFTYIEQKRPYIILKWAQSADGYMAPSAETPYWLSSPTQNRLNHRWRTEEAAILVGSTTYLKDNPALTARHFLGPQPQPIVIDRRQRIKDLPPHWIALSHPTLEENLNQLRQKQIQSVIVEGGRTLLDAFIERNLYDEVRILKSPSFLGSGLEAPPLSSIDISRLRHE